MFDKQLPYTGVDQPYLKKRPIFLKETPDYELVNIHSGLPGVTNNGS
jgi:hypothetical protein